MRHNQPEKLGSLGSDVWRLTQSNPYHTWLWETALYNNTCIASLYVKKPKRISMRSLKFNSVLNLSGWWGFKSTVEIRWWLMFFSLFVPFFFFNTTFYDYKIECRSIDNSHFDSDSKKFVFPYNSSSFKLCRKKAGKCYY